jgi:hypothetical protein
MNYAKAAKQQAKLNFIERHTDGMFLFSRRIEPKPPKKITWGRILCVIPKPRGGFKYSFNE